MYVSPQERGTKTAELPSATEVKLSPFEVLAMMVNTVGKATDNLGEISSLADNPHYQMLDASVDALEASVIRASREVGTDVAQLIAAIRDVNSKLEEFSTGSDHSFDSEDGKSLEAASFLSDKLGGKYDKG